MNSRDYKEFSAGSYYHVFNRGVNREVIFLDDQDSYNCACNYRCAKEGSERVYVVKAFA
jgi:hypothetical protein